MALRITDWAEIGRSRQMRVSWPPPTRTWKLRSAQENLVAISTSKSTGPMEARSTTIDEVEKQLILDTLNKSGGHRGRAAEQLGVSRRTLTRKLKLYRLESAQVAASALGALSYEQQRYFR